MQNLSKIHAGQTINHFSTCWSGHRAFWNNNNNAKGQQNIPADSSSVLASRTHEFSAGYFRLFEVIFLQEPRDQQKLAVLKSMRINRLVSEININKTVLPKYR